MTLRLPLRPAASPVLMLETLRRKQTLHVIVKETYSWPTEPDVEHLWEIFTTVLTLPR